MQILKLKVSNLENFKFIDNLDKTEWINFHIKENWITNIIIWPNWSWKTSILEIINQIIKIWIQNDYLYDKHILEKNFSQLSNFIKKLYKKHNWQKMSDPAFFIEKIKWFRNKKSKSITTINHKFQNLQKNIFYTNKKSEFYIKLFLTKKDIINLHFIQQNIDLINFYIKTFYNNKIQFLEADIDLIEFDNTIWLYWEFDFKNKKIIINEKNLSNYKKFILQYLRHYELLKIIFHIHNKYLLKFDKTLKLNEKEKTFYKKLNKFFYNNSKFDLKTKIFPELWNSFAILWAKRDFDWQFTYKSKYTDKELDIKTHKTNTKQILYWWLWYLLVRKKIRKIIRKYWIDNLYKNTFWKNLNNTFEKYLWIKLNIKYTNDKVEIFIDKKNYWLKKSANPTTETLQNKTFFKFDDLSSWEESFSLLILTIFGYDLYNWTMIIDEPELHLHPQSQLNFLKLLKEFEKKFKIQFIIATHSPVFISPENLKNTIRINKEQWFTQIYNCKQNISSQEYNLVHMLKYENISKIFFVDKIIMVEWETDLYFFNYYLNFLNQNNQVLKEKITNYEIIDIWWKWSFEKRKKLLSKFWIKSYYIWDWDNILDSNIYQEVYYYKKLLKKHYFKKYDIKHKTQTYWKLILYIKEQKPQLYKKLINKINQLYQKNIFLLKKWDLETYIWLEKKWLWPTVKFCQKDFYKWLKNKKFDEHRKELNKIFEKIFW